jgi:hypothetical protein
VVCPVFQAKEGLNLGNSLLSHYAAGNTGAGKTRGNLGRAAVHPRPVPRPDIATDRSYYGSHRDRQLLRGGYDRTATGACPAGHSILPGDPVTHRDEKRRDGYRAAGRAGRDRQDEAVVKAGAWRAGERGRAGRETGPGRGIDEGQDPAGALMRGQDPAGHCRRTGVGRAFMPGRCWAMHLYCRA